MTLRKQGIFPLSPSFLKVMSLYRTAFPPEERLPLGQLFLNSLKRGQSFSAYYDGSVFVGFTYVIETEDFVFLLFLAVDGRHRSQGYGGQILEEVAELAGFRSCVLTIEPMDDREAVNYDQRVRRLAFYASHGYQALNHYYYEGKERYQILTTDSRLSLDKLEQGLASTFLGRYGIRID